MPFLCCLALLFATSASANVHDQGVPGGQSSCISDPEATSLLQSAVHGVQILNDQKLSVKVDEQTNHEGDQEDDDDDEEEEGNEKDEELMEAQGRPKGAKRCSKLPQPTFTTEELGHRICQHCKKPPPKQRKILKKLGLDFDKCFQKDLWPQAKVKITCRRRRSESKKDVCFAPSFAPYTKRKIWFGFATNRNKEKLKEWAEGSNKMCECLHNLISQCDDAECLKGLLCNCPAVCNEFKELMGCPADKRRGKKFSGKKRRGKRALLEINDAKNNISESESLASRTRTGTAVQNDLDTSVQGKCTAETQ